MLTIFRSYEKEIKTDRPVQKVIDRLRRRAYFTDTAFRISARKFSRFRGTRVEGRVNSINNKTIVSFRIYPSADMQAGAVMMLLAVLMLPVVGLVYLTTGGKADMRLTVMAILGIPGVLLIVLVLLRLVYKFSVSMQHNSISDLVLHDDLQNGQ